MRVRFQMGFKIFSENIYQKAISRKLERKCDLISLEKHLPQPSRTMKNLKKKIIII